MLVLTLGDDSKVRASFTLLLVRLWVDRFPHEAMCIPKYVYVLDEVRDVRDAM